MYRQGPDFLRDKRLFEISEVEIARVNCTCTQQPLYKMVYYKTVSDIKWFENGPQKSCIQTKMFRLYRTRNSPNGYVVIATALNTQTKHCLANMKSKSR